jgi:glycosyltransferase involved in cell wall biosynthesis
MGGAIPEVVPPAAGILVSPEDVAALATSLRRMIADPVTRQRFAAGARAAAEALPRWEETARSVATVLEKVSNA